MIKHYQYRTSRKRPSYIKRQTPRLVPEEEALTGYVNNFPASDIEERFARALVKRDIEFMFRISIGEKRGDPGWKELDFLVNHNFTYYPVEIDDITFVHRGRESKDVLHDALVLEYLKEYSPRPVIHITNEQLESQEEADAVVRELFL